MHYYTITPLMLGTITRPVSNMLYGSQDATPFDFPLIAYYLEGNGRRLLVDTGGSVPQPESWHQPYTRAPNEELDVALTNIGVSTYEIDTVLFTHLHWDHAQNNHLLPHAKFIVQRAELDAFEAAADKGYEAEEFGKTTYETVEGDCVILPGIRALLVPGHSKGSQAFIVDTAEGRALITGDLVPRYVNWESSPKIPNGGYDDYGAMLASYDKLAAAAQELSVIKIYPGHEPRVFTSEV